MPDISISLPDGSVRTLPEGATGTDLAADIGPGLAKAALVVEVDGEARDLAAPLADGDAVRIVTERDPDALEHIRHSTAHVLAQAVLELWPGATFAGGPAITRSKLNFTSAEVRSSPLLNLIPCRSLSVYVAPDAFEAMVQSRAMPVSLDSRPLASTPIR